MTTRMPTPAPHFKTPSFCSFSRSASHNISQACVLTLYWLTSHSVRSTPVAHLHLQFFPPNIAFLYSIFVPRVISLSLSAYAWFLTANPHTRLPVPSLSQYDASLCMYSGTLLVSRYPTFSARLILCTWRPFQQAIYFFLSWAGVTTTLIPALSTRGNRLI